MICKLHLLCEKTFYHYQPVKLQNHLLGLKAWFCEVICLSDSASPWAPLEGEQLRP